MGKVLQVRVAAWTYSEDEVEKTWPSLWKLVWGEGGDAVPDKGVIALVQAVFNAVRGGLVDDVKAEALKEGAELVEDLRFQIQDALADWNPKQADKLIYQLEDGLDALEDIAANF